MNMKTEPWIEDNDPLKPYYGKLSNKEYTDISNIFTLWINHKNYIDPSIISKNKKLNLLDFSNRYKEKCNQSLYELLCESLKQTDGYLYFILFLIRSLDMEKRISDLGTYLLQFLP